MNTWSRWTGDPEVAEEGGVGLGEDGLTVELVQEDPAKGNVNFAICPWTEVF